MGRGELAAHARMSLRNNRIAEAGHKHALVEQQLTHTNRLRGFAQDHGYDGRLARQWFEAERQELLAEVASVLMQRADELGMRFDVAHGRERAGGDGRRERVAEE